jgi:excisionase family DNA binding protein
VTRRTWTVLTPREVADATGIPYESVLDHLGAGELRGVKRGSRWYIREEAVDEFLSPDTPAETA